MSPVKGDDFAYYPHANIRSRVTERNLSGKKKNSLSAAKALAVGGVRKAPPSTLAIDQKTHQDRAAITIWYLTRRYLFVKF